MNIDLSSLLSHPLVFVVIGGLFLLVANRPILAQDASRTPNGAVDLPTWAEPHRPNAQSGPSPSAHPLQSEPTKQHSAQTQQQETAPPPPLSPSQVPIGGIEWLALLGLGSGVRRLYRSKPERETAS
jgi:hypothetical protein